MATSIKDTSKPWSKIAEKWETYFKPPSRPSGHEINKYAEWVSNHANPTQKALVLGATPELLDILTERSIKTDLIDISEEMVLAMQEITKQPTAKQNVTIGNWLDMPLNTDNYDLVLGDAVVPNVPFESRGKLIREIKRVLKPGGLFLNRAFCVPEEKPYNSVDQVLLNFRDKKVNETTAIELVLEIQILTYEPADHLGSMPKVRDVITKLRNKKGFHRQVKRENELLDILWEYWLKDISDKVWVYDTRKSEERQLYKPNFKILNIFTATDHPYGKITPMYLLENTV